MPLSEAMGLAIRMMRANLLRTLLTVAGTVVGVAFLIAVVTVIDGMGRYLEHDLLARIYGVHTIKLRQRPPILSGDVADARRYARNPALTLDDAEWLASRMRTPGELAVSTTSRTRASTPGGGGMDGVRLQAVSASHFRVQGLRMDAGRIFSDREGDRGIPVAVVGRDVAARLFPGQSALGRTVHVEGTAFKVVGVMERQGALFSLSMDRVVLVAARSPLNGALLPRNEVEVIAFRVADPARMTDAVAELQGWMRMRHGLRPLDADDFALTTSRGAMELWEKVSGVLLVAAPTLIAIALLVGALVSANVMLVSVSERTHEIGIRLSLGARRRDILLQFLVEAATTAGVGGVAGVVLGGLFAAGVAAFTPLPVRIAPWSLAAGVGVGIAVGLLAGVYPAHRASRLNPIEALGHE